MVCAPGPNAIPLDTRAARKYLRWRDVATRFSVENKNDQIKP
jgi:hypothetical protein